MLDVLFNYMGVWGKGAQTCGPQSHAFVYVLLCVSLVIAAGGVFVWFRFIKSKPGTGAPEHQHHVEVESLPC